ncbi:MULTISPECIES: hypothetical protein [Bacillus cereus group]|uniref:hypothetical protein n=1 Tax=Bacillus cereus group TaxID=86661 RepID=UPI000772B38D|nr:MULTISPECIES: hypothetical protein [Bacillus cereus group]MCC2538521.1 hypothetical protein [Bacillus paranthracis]MCH5436583.1 hypothetical protein [Bacillus paranthracis]MCU5172557.1 hypothetical protein [Bacillus paranthracis]MDA1915626.1 hypothetical protein [Bacillus cereus group sp. BcHK140]MDA2193141.1 hypothetical protein [Bacillus cereus group sp. Bc238]
MSSDIKELKAIIEQFQKHFTQYYNHFFEFYNAKKQTDNIYNVAHPELVEDSIKLQVHFLKLPQQIQKRLLDIDFEVFMHCNNVVDFYSLREYLYENQKLYTIATLVERIDAELKLAYQIMEADVLDYYDMLPKRNINFYRKEKYVSLLHGNDCTEISQEDTTDEKEELHYKTHEDTWKQRLEHIDEGSSKDILKQYNAYVDTANDSIEKTKKFGTNLSPILTWAYYKIFGV